MSEVAAPSIRVEHVSRRYGEVLAVNDVSFRVAPGEVVGLLGANGAGKTTTLRMIATLIPPDSGRVTVGGYDVTQDALRARSALGYQTGDTGLYVRLTPREFLTYFGTLHGLTGLDLEARVDWLIDEFGIHEFHDRLCGNLSTGQKQRVSIARTLVADPRVLVFDEPTSGLDIVSSAFVLESLRRFANEGRAVLFSTHVMSEVELICDRIVLLHRGRILARGTVDQIRAAAGAASLTHAFLTLVERADAASAA